MKLDTIISAFIASILGSFLGVFFKEMVGDWFGKARRKREIRISLIQTLSVFYGVLNQHIVNVNMHAIELAKYNQLNLLRKTIKPELLEDLNKDLLGRFEHSKLLAELHLKDFAILNEMEGKIVALTLETSHYFESFIYKQLDKNIKEGLEGNSLVTDFTTMTYPELEKYAHNEYVNAVTNKKNVMRLKKEKLLVQVSEILK